MSLVDVAYWTAQHALKSLYSIVDDLASDLVM
jgi:hypothetical protein